MNMRLLFLYMQAAGTFAVDREQQVEEGEGSAGTDIVSVPLSHYVSKHTRDGWIEIPSRKVFVEELKALSDPETRIGWRFFFVLYDDTTGWHELTTQCLRDNEMRGQKRRIKPEEYKVHPEWRIDSREKLAVLYAFYEGDPVESGPKYHRALHKGNYHDPSNRACPITVLNFERSCQDFDRFQTAAEMGSLSSLDMDEPPMVEQCMRTNYINVTQTGAVLTFPIPDSVWEIPQNYRSFVGLNGCLFPGYGSSAMKELANKMRECRISVMGDMNSITNDVAGQFLSFQDTARLQAGAEEVSMAVIDATKDSRSLGNAAFDCNTRIDISTLSPNEQFEMTSCLVRLRNENKPVALEFKRSNLTKQEFDQQYASYRKDAIKSFMQEVFRRDNSNLSEAGRAVVNHLLGFLQERRATNQPIIPNDFVVPVTDPTLTPNANYVKFLLDEAESNGMATFHVADFLIWSGMQDVWRYGMGMHINFALTGKHGSGKSYLMALNMARAVPGVSKNIMHETSKAEMTGGNRNFEQKYLEELPCWMFGNAEGQGAETGDPTLKARLTQCIISVVFFHSDKETGTRQRRVMYAQAIGCLCAGTNEEWFQMPPALRDRFMHITAPKMLREGATAADRISMGKINPFDYTTEISINRFRFEQCMIALVEFLITTRCIGVMTDGVNMQLFHLIAKHHYSELEELGVDTSNVRCRERVLYLARTLTIRFAIYQLFFQPLSAYRMRKTFNLEQFAIEVEKLLVCTEEITNFAFELASSQFVDPNIDPVISELCRMTHYTGTTMRGADQDGVVRETSIPSTNIDVTTDRTTMSTGVANFVESCTVQSVEVSTAQTLYAKETDSEGNVTRDYDYVEYHLDLNGLTTDIAARIAQCDMALAPPDIKTVLRTLSKQKFRARPRSASNVPDMSKSEEFYSVVVIDDFNRKVRILCAYMDRILQMRGRNLVQEVISRHRHPKQRSYDTVSMVPIPGFPDLLPRRCVRPCTQEEYERAGVQYLMSVDMTIKTQEELQELGMFPTFPTQFFLYFSAFYQPVICFDRFGPEMEALLQHMIITGNNPNAEFKYFPVGQQAFQNIVALAQKLYTIDCNKERDAHMNGVEYEREYPRVKDAFDKAQEMEASSTVKFSPSYPVKQIFRRALKNRTMIYTSGKNVRRRIYSLKERFAKALALSGTVQFLDDEDKAKWTKIKFDVNPAASNRIEQPSFAKALMPMRMTSSGLTIFAGNMEEGSLATRNPDQLLLEYGNSEQVQDMVLEEQASSSTRKRGLEKTYDGVWTKRQHLLDGEVEREARANQEMNQEREQRRLAAREAIAQTLRPAETQQSISEQDLFDRFEEIRPSTSSGPDPNMPIEMSGTSMPVNDIMAQNGVMAL